MCVICKVDCTYNEIYVFMNKLYSHIIHTSIICVWVHNMHELEISKVESTSIFAVRVFLHKRRKLNCIY